MWLGLVVPEDAGANEAIEVTEVVDVVTADEETNVTHIDFKRPAPEPESEKIVWVQPEKYADAKVIGEHYLSNVPVVVDLSSMSTPDAKRLVDFSAGLTFGTLGKLERVTKNVFLLTPLGMSVSEMDRDRIANTPKG
ncbi:MAG: cell division protein SepF [Propionibacteriaceae bacterium]|nr:cell division protein SepF [Propionibacteriaceae bacterium]